MIGFVGRTGDAEATPPHLHFEIHPSELLDLGYDGVVNPYRALLAWRRLDDAVLVGNAWRPDPGPAPPAAAVLLAAEDISAANGTRPGALEEAVTVPEASAGPCAARSASGP